MPMILPVFTNRDLAELCRVLVAEDENNFKRGQDVELAQDERIILRATDGSRWAVTVTTGGVLGTTGL